MSHPRPGSAVLPCPGAPPGAIPVSTAAIRVLLATTTHPGASLDDTAAMVGKDRYRVDRARRRLAELDLIIHDRNLANTWRSRLTIVACDRRVTRM